MAVRVSIWMGGQRGRGRCRRSKGKSDHIANKMLKYISLCFFNAAHCNFDARGLCSIAPFMVVVVKSNRTYCKNSAVPVCLYFFPLK